MRLLDEKIECSGRDARVEIFPIYDVHMGKRNCAEDKLKSEKREILRREKLPNRYVRVVMGGDICDVIKPQDIRFDFDGLADWIYEGSADDIRKKLNDIAEAQVTHAANFFKPISHLIIGNIEANHDKAVRRRYNVDTHRNFCKALGIRDMTDEAIIRFTFYRIVKGRRCGSQIVKLYMRHGYGGGRTAGTEPNKIARMMGDGVTADCDVCLTGHTHTACNPDPVPVLYTPNRGKLPARLLTRYRFGLNPGCWLYSHLVGQGTYESASCYPSRALMTTKIVIWPFWHTEVGGVSIERPKIEVRQYPIL